VLERIPNYLDTVAKGKNFSAADKVDLEAIFLEIYGILEEGKIPTGFRLATGEVAKGATGRTALKAYLLLLARKVYGSDYFRHDQEINKWSMDLAFWIMRSNFTQNQPKGVFCCWTCTLSVLPLYAHKVFPWIPCDELQKNVISLISSRESVFKRKISDRYVAWSLQFVKPPLVG
jgi:hypothetical protein